jgi:hypothetical protein
MEMIDQDGNRCMSGTMDGVVVLARYEAARRYERQVPRMRGGSERGMTPERDRELSVVHESAHCFAFALFGARRVRAWLTPTHGGWTALGPAGPLQHADLHSGRRDRGGAASRSRRETRDRQRAKRIVAEITASARATVRHGRSQTPSPRPRAALRRTDPMRGAAARSEGIAGPCRGRGYGSLLSETESMPRLRLTDAQVGAVAQVGTVATSHCRRTRVLAPGRAVHRPGALLTPDAIRAG